MSDEPWFRAHVGPLLGDRVRHLGLLDQAVLADVVRHAAVALVTPTWDEPFGLVAAEVLCCGTPVAALARGALPDVVGPGGVVCTDAADLPAAIARARTLDRAEVAGPGASASASTACSAPTTPSTAPPAELNHTRLSDERWAAT